MENHLKKISYTSKAIALGSVCVVGIVGLCLFIFHSRLSTLTLSSDTLFSQPTSDGRPLPVPTHRSSFVVYGYLPYWTRAEARFAPELTHVSYFSLGIQADGRILNIPKENREPGYNAYQKGVLGNLRTEIGSGQKLELTITMMDQEAIPIFVASPSARQQFVQDLATVIDNAPITGINIDVEYNGIVDETLQDSFTSLISQVRTLLNTHSPPLSLSIATYGDAGTLQRVTNIHDIAPHVDHIIIMAYDYHSRKSPRVGPVSPLYGKSAGKWEADIMNDLKSYTDAVPSEKILLGIPFYGYEWQIEDPSDPNSFAIPRTGATATYKRVQEILKRPNITKIMDPLAFSPYLLFTERGKNHILYYEDAQSLELKLQLVRQANLGGIAIWALGYEGETMELWKTIGERL